MVSYYGQSRPEPSHWVAVAGPIVDAGPAGTHWRLPLWSWGRQFTIDIEKQYLGDWIYRWVIGRVR